VTQVHNRSDYIDNKPSDKNIALGNDLKITGNSEQLDLICSTLFVIK